MKILNISASMLVFALLCSLSCASNELNDELGTTGPTPTIAPFQNQDPTKYPSEWPQTGSSAKFWKQYWNAKLVTRNLLSRGANNIQGVFTGNFNEGQLVDGKQSYTPLSLNGRLSSLAAGPVEIVLAPIAGLLLFSVSYFKSDENGDWINTTKPGGPQSDQPSRGSSILGAIFGLVTLPATLADKIANKK